PWMVEQPHTEAVLEEALLAYGIVVERGVSLVSYIVKSSGIEAVINNNGEQSVNNYKYLIGADGAHSIVRKLMPSRFSGSTYEDAFILADALCDFPYDHRTLRFFFRGRAFFAMLPLAGERHYRLISVRRDDAGHSGPPPTLDEFRELALRVVPF